MKSDNNLVLLLSLTIILTVALFLSKVSYFYLAFPPAILIIGLASDKLANGIVVTLKTIANFLVLLASKILLTILFFTVLFPVVFFQGLLQRYNAHKTPKPII